MSRNRLSICYCVGIDICAVWNISRYKSKEFLNGKFRIIYDCHRLTFVHHLIGRLLYGVQNS